jgi:hypothetical protein
LETEQRRRAAKTSLISFTEYTYPRYQAAAIHHQIADQLESVERGEIDRLMLLVPPRHGKSELASRRFPAWYLGRHPDHQFISASASVTLAEDFGRDVRNLIASPDYAQVFDTQLAEDSQARGYDPARRELFRNRCRRRAYGTRGTRAADRRSFRQHG